MAVVVAPTPIGNHCKGVFANGDADIRMKCVKMLDNDGAPVYTCAGKRWFRVNCPKLNQLCSNLSGAWVPAITVCNQKLF